MKRKKKNKRMEFNEFVKNYLFMLAIINSPEPEPISMTATRIKPIFKKPELSYMDSVIFD